MTYSPSFSQFIQDAPALVKSGLYDFANVNLYKTIYMPLSVDASAGHVNGNVHRCHLVDDWLRVKNLPVDLKPRVGFSTGVRHTLKLLASELSERHWIIPEDVYPVYSHILGQASVFSVSKYPSILSIVPSPQLVKDIENSCEQHSSVVLITLPHKPSGISITDCFEGLRELARSVPNSIIIVDCAYCIGAIPEELLNIQLEFKNVILMFSLSKGWLIPDVAGFTILPTSDFMPIFRSANIPEEKLRLAYSALNSFAHVPGIVADILANYIKYSNSFLGLDLPVDYNNPSYLFYSEIEWEQWLDKGILTIPLSVFGSSGLKGSIISTLPAVPR